MADILRVTTPLATKQTQTTTEVRRPAEVAQQFPVQDVTRVTRPAGQSELLSQNNGLIQQDETSALLLNLLKDPSVTVNFLKSISSMEALIRLLPANNSPFTQEIQQLFDQLLVPHDQIAREMGRQEEASTFFKGDLFELLRRVIHQDPENKELRESTVSFLKALTLFYTRREALGSVSNSLRFLADTLNSSKTLAGKLGDLAERFRAANATRNFPTLQQETLTVLKEVEDSILFSTKAEKIVKMVVYNLSRYNDNGDFLQEAVSKMLVQLRGNETRGGFLQALELFLEKARDPERRESSAMDVLTKILEQQTDNEQLMAVSSDKVDKILHSLLSSPCNFTPLLHFVLPVHFEGLQSFAEIWINPNGEEDDRNHASDGVRTIHMLLSFDIDSIGHFELELFARDNTLDFFLYCPPSYTKVYSAMEGDLRKCVTNCGYKVGEVQVEKLGRHRSLMDVFKSLPYKRTGVDVKI